MRYRTDDNNFLMTERPIGNVWSLGFVGMKLVAVWNFNDFFDVWNWELEEIAWRDLFRESFGLHLEFKVSKVLHHRHGSSPACISSSVLLVFDDFLVSRWFSVYLNTWSNYRENFKNWWRRNLSTRKNLNKNRVLLLSSRKNGKKVNSIWTCNNQIQNNKKLVTVHCHHLTCGIVKTHCTSFDENCQVCFEKTSPNLASPCRDSKMFRILWLRRLIRRNTKPIPFRKAVNWKERLSIAYMLVAWNAIGFVGS